MSNMVSEYWFPTPTWYGYFSDICEEDITLAIDFCYKQAHTNPGRILSNVGGWQSNNFWWDDLLNTPLEKFLMQIDLQLPQITCELGLTKKLQLNNLWININSKNHYNRKHTHPGSPFSGVFYLTNSNSKLMLTRPKDIMDYFLVNNFSSKNTYTSFGTVEYDTEKSKFIIFPGWLIHSVSPHTENSDRISISFNTNLVDY